MELSTLQYQGYTARIINLSTNEEIQDWVEECNITLPQSNLISSMEARFQLEEKKINKGNEIKIEILDELGNTLYTMQGEANIPKRSKSYTGLETWEYTVKDSYNRLFEKVVPESQTFYDLYLCNTNDKHNSLLHKIASALGFREEELDFESVAFENGNLIRLPFVYLEESSRWIDKLQAFIEATDGILYVKNKKLFFRPRSFEINHNFALNIDNIRTVLEESEKEILQNGVKVVYDRFEKLENQVVFNLKKKIITEPNTNLDTEVPIMRISYITSAVSTPTLTKATGYYFTSDDPNSKVDIELKENIHYQKVSWKETGAEIKFYNPYSHKLYVDNFEIKGVPLSMYENNEVNVMFSNILEKHQENFITVNKNKFIQTSTHAKFLAKKAMRRSIVNTKEYHFKTPFLHQIEIGGIYGLDLEDIHTVIEIKNISIHLKPGIFTMDIQAESIQQELENIKISSKLAGTPKGNYVDLKPLEEELQKQKGELKILDRDVRSKLYKMKTQPTEDVNENDIWLNPETNEWKKYYNGVWNPISEKEILPSMKVYNSLDNNVIKLQGTADKVGAYLLNDGEKFGGLNGEIAHVTFDKLGQFEAENPNNRVALNIKDPANPSKVTSQILLGVTDIRDEKYKDVSFQVGDEATGHFIQFKNGMANIVENGKTISSVDEALQTGDFTITGRTNFDGSARFISRGTNEVITIANGAIDFHRDGKRLTRIKNIRHGTIATDSQGKAVINFDGFKQPMIVHTSIKSAHFGKNMASVFCYAEHISGTQYRFYVGGTNEYWVEATPVKTIGTEWRAENAMNSTLLGIGGRLQGFTKKEYAYSQTTTSDYTAKKIKEHIKNKGITTLPRFNLKVIREDGSAQTILLDRDYTVGASYKHDMPANGSFYRWHLTMDTVDFSSLFNILKTYSSRTNVKFKIVITILEKNLDVEMWNETSKGYSTESGSIIGYKFGAYKGTAYSLSMSDFVGLFITASASTSTLGGVTGTGEVSYIAMEID